MRRFFNSMTYIVLCATAVAAVFFVWAHFIEPSMLRVRTQEVELLKNAPPHSVRIAHFSDTHLGFSCTASQLESTALKLSESKPDIIIFTGDLYDNYPDSDEDDASVIAALSAFSAPYGKFAVLGNHDNVPGARRKTEEILAAGGFTILSDEYAYIPECEISIYGMKDYFSGGKAENFVPKPDACNIVLCHEPDMFDKIKGADIVFSGHTHGGQVVLPLFGPLILPNQGKKYPAGLYSADDSFLYVSRGLGNTILNLRFLCPPEANIIQIK